MKAILVCLLGATAAILAAGVPMRNNPDQFMFNDGMMGGDVAGGYLTVDLPDGRTAIIPDSGYVFWPNAVIPYELHESLADVRDVIEDAMEEYHRRTCIRFVPRNGDTSINNYLLIRGDLQGCWSYMGMYTGGPQEVSLQHDGCVWKGIVIHELMHAAGFWHEHQRFDRDNYIYIHYENVYPEYAYAFDVADLSMSQDHGVPYDFQSIMHYELTAFTSNGLNTIEPIGEWTGTDPGFVWQKNSFSDNDIAQISIVYGCAAEN